MSEKATPTPHQVAVNKFAFCLLKHFSKGPVKIQGDIIKIHVDQICGQDIDFLYHLNQSTGDKLGLNLSRSGKGICILIGAVEINETPDYLKRYVRQDVTMKYQ